MEYQHGWRRSVGPTVLLVGLAVAGCQDQTVKAKNPPAVVKVENAALTEFSPAIRLTGEVRARVDRDLAFKVAGRITERLVDIGDKVTADQILARLDPQQQAATVTAAQAAVVSAEAGLRQATSTFERQAVLLARGFTTGREHDKAEEAFQSAKAALEVAKAQLGTASDSLSDTVLKAGVAGIVTARKSEAGQIVQAGQTVFSIAEDGRRDAVFNVDESVFSNELAGPDIALTLVSDPTVSATGNVREIAPTVDTATSTVVVKVAIQEPPEGLTLGAAVVGEGRLPSRDFVAIPWSAISSDAGRPAAWTVDPATGAVVLNPIEVEAYETSRVIVRNGLEAGDVVVTGGSQFLRPGQVVALAQGAVQ